MFPTGTVVLNSTIRSFWLMDNNAYIQYDNFCEHMAQMLMFPTGMVVLNSTRRSFWL